MHAVYNVRKLHQLHVRMSYVFSCCDSVDTTLTIVYSCTTLQHLRCPVNCTISYPA